MEEADILSDMIGIMSNGVIKCLGTPLQLKNEYGSGYRINLNAQINHSSSSTEKSSFKPIYQVKLFRLTFCQIVQFFFCVGGSQILAETGTFFCGCLSF